MNTTTTITATITTTISNIAEGDVISFHEATDAHSNHSQWTCEPGEQLKVVASWWDSHTKLYKIQLDECHGDAVISFYRGSDLITLHQNPASVRDGLDAMIDGAASLMYIGELQVLVEIYEPVYGIWEAYTRTSDVGSLNDAITKDSILRDYQGIRLTGMYGTFLSQITW